MMPDREFKPGDVLGAHTLNALWAAVRALGKITGVAPVRVSQDDGGTVVAVELPEVWWLQLGAGNGAGAYAWTRVVAGSTAGTWTTSPGGETGTTTVDPAYELNAYTGITGSPVVKAWREPGDNSLRFARGSCS